MNTKQYIRDNYLSMSNAEMSEATGITVGSVKKHMGKMGLRRSDTAFPEDQWVEVEVCKLLTCKFGDYATAPSRFITIRARDVE